jgi:glycosyltransferase involved in cell wall biosynthesis
MKILKIIHGYPPLYNAGSEVYSQMLCHGLSDKHDVHVFTREENLFEKDFSMRLSQDNLKSTITLHLINIPLEKFRYRLQHPEVDQIFSNLLDKIKPDIIHIGHLNHLSTSLVYEISKKNIPIVYTLHDYWLMCPRGQFIQRNTQSFELCDGQEDRKCATQCYSGYFMGAPDELESDTNYWTNWISRRMAHIRDIANYINIFIAPSKYLYNRYIQAFNLPQKKMIYLDYGFDLTRLKNRHRKTNEPFTFGYIGTHIPAKGIQDLLIAFGKLTGPCKLRIWGRPRSQNTEALHAIASSLPIEIQHKIEWLSEYQNENIVKDVFNHTDCIVVPSIWVENSPLVIHEALQVRIPVITANTGGMSEYIHHEKNGLLFNHRDNNSLALQMQRLLDDPKLALNLGNTGYLYSSDGNIPELNSHVTDIENIYRSLLKEGTSANGNTSRTLANHI